MKRNDLLTPEGTRDYLFEECAAKRSIMNKLRGLFERFGYSEVMTPGIEFYDVFNSKARHFPQESMYKLVDGKNRLMVLRPDNTLPIARLCATRLRGEELPLKLFYNQNIFMVNPKDSGRDDEISQCGIEIIGGESDGSDYEALFLAAKALAACDEDFRLEIGDSGIYRELARSYVSERGVDENREELVRSSIETKNYPVLDELFKDEKSAVGEAFRALPRLFGGREVFGEAKKYLGGEVMNKKLARLEKLYDDLSGIIPEEKLRVDLGLVHKKNYYTGIIFRGYVEGYGQPVLSGGRYDKLLGEFGADANAIGFAVNVEAAAKALPKKTDERLIKAPDVIVFAEKGCETAAMKHCDELISGGFKVYHFLGYDREKLTETAKRLGIKRIDIIDAKGNISSVSGMEAE